MFGKARRGPQSKLIFCVVGFLSEMRKNMKNIWRQLKGEAKSKNPKWPLSISLYL